MVGMGFEGRGGVSLASRAIEYLSAEVVYAVTVDEARGLVNKREHPQLVEGWGWGWGGRESGVKVRKRARTNKRNVRGAG